jgi:hypothetical protein
MGPEGLATLLFDASGVMKVFMFDKVSEGVPSFGALPFTGTWRSRVAATVLTIESLVFVSRHV